MRRGATVVPSFDDPAIVAGQGTAGLEIVEQLRARRRDESSSPAVAVACIGNCARVPGRGDRHCRARGLGRHGAVARAGRDRARRPDAPDTFCDALQTPRVSPITFGIWHRGQRRYPSATPRWRTRSASPGTHQLVVEPGGAVGLAALLAGKLAPREDSVVVLSGGNVDPALHARIVARTRLSDVAGLVFARFDMDRAGALDRLGQLFELGGEGLNSRRGTGAHFRRPTRTRRSAFRASSRCTAGSFPRSARTPLQGALAGPTSARRPMWTELG